MKLRLTSIITLIFVVSWWLGAIPPLPFRYPSLPQVQAETDPVDQADQLRQQIDELEAKLKETGARRTTLANEINYQTNQIKLTELKISQTTEQIKQLNQEIDSLSVKIDKLNTSLDYLSEVLVSRVRETYKYSQYNPIFFLLSSNGLSQVFNRAKYLQLSQKNDKAALLKLETARTNYDTQKQVKLDKQAQLEALEAKLERQKVTLASQRAAKQYLLEETKNDEKRYQALLAKTRIELEAIQAIVAGKGQEEAAGEVKKGDTIAYIIPTASCNSSGPHLHFMVREGSYVKNPFSYLRDISHRNCSAGWQCDSGGEDPFNPSGSWDWPLEPQITLNQGYGRTWAIRNHVVWYNHHNGIDIKGGSNRVKAVADGTLYRGSYTGNGGCALKYVRVDHQDSDLDTLYLHINYF